MERIRSCLYETRKSFNSFALYNRIEKNPVTFQVKMNAFNKSVDELHDSLLRVDKSQINGQWMSGDSQEIPMGQEHLHAILDECYCLLYELKERMNSISKS